MTTQENKEYIPSALPIDYGFYQKPEIIKAVIEANKFLSELKGVAKTIPNENILINTLILQEAKDSSEIENIVTTHDDLYRAMIDSNNLSPQTKEVKQYREAIMTGYLLIKKRKLLTLQEILKIHEVLAGNNSGLRKLPGTRLINDVTGETILIPPQDYGTIKSLLSNLLDYINDDTIQDLDPTIKVAIIHYQFESIHPFYDGNGRTGRIINILYLILKGLLDTPILYLSRYIIRHKNTYYQLLGKVREENRWDEWVLFILQGIKETAIETMQKIQAIKDIMQKTKYSIREKAPKIYSKDLLEIIFYHPYTKINFVAEHLGIHRQTATKYLNTLSNIGILKKEKQGREYYYINTELYNLFAKS